MSVLIFKLLQKTLLAPHKLLWGIFAPKFNLLRKAASGKEGLLICLIDALKVLVYSKYVAFKLCAKKLGFENRSTFVLSV